LRALDDQSLFRELRDGSELAFSVFYERYRTLIYSFILQRIRNHADAEELVQETFAAVFLSIERYSGKAAPLAWVYGVAKNTTYNRLRLQKRRSERMAEIGGDPLGRIGDVASENPEAQMECRRTLEELCARLEMLRPWQIEVFMLRHVDNLPIREIAARMNRSNDAIRSSLYRMKRLLTAQAARGARMSRGTTPARQVP
jgi:RNA polymerase sigma-70 factor (ECF subfamily)